MDAILIILGIMGFKQPSEVVAVMGVSTFTVTTWSQLGTLIYFGFFAYLFLFSKGEKGAPLPERVTDR